VGNQNSKIMNRQLIILGFLTIFTSCYTETKKPDYKFMNTIKTQATLDSTLKTTIEIIPKKYYFGSIKQSNSINGHFFIKNTGQINFNIISIKSNCNCIKTNYAEMKFIKPNDSLKVEYQMNVTDVKGQINTSIIAIGNCQFGNQTYYLEGFFINH